MTVSQSRSKAANREWCREATHWKVTFSYEDKEFETFYSMGSGHLGAEPDLEDVLNCLAMDCRMAEFAFFEDYCNEFGFDSDSRKAEKSWNIVRDQRTKLQEFFGDKFDEFLLLEE